VSKKTAGGEWHPAPPQVRDSGARGGRRVSTTPRTPSTIAASLDFSAQSLERSGGWFDSVAGEELGRAYGARLEQQIWAGTAPARTAN